MNYVFDSSALIAFLHGARGADTVERILLATPQASCVHALNVCEVYYDAHRRGGPSAADAALEGLFQAGLVFREDLSLMSAGTEGFQIEFIR